MGSFIPSKKHITTGVLISDAVCGGVQWAL